MVVLLPFLLTSSMTMAQSREITGQVTDASTGEALLAVSIVAEGTQTGSVTNEKGTYSITVQDQNSILNFSHVGYSTQSISIGSQTIININLAPEAMSIDEVMFIGYGTIKKSDLTGAVSTVKADDIRKASPVSFQTALQGRAAGVFVSQNSGVPGGEPVIRIRGTGSISEHAPIYVIDGTIMDISEFYNEANRLSFLNPADIASIEVLKDASATAIYGSRGANGVVLITTKKGLDAGPEVSFNTQFGFAWATPLPEVLNADEYLDFVRDANFNGYLTMYPDADPDADPDTINQVVIETIEQHSLGYDTDWMKEVQKDGPALSQDYNLAIRGGTSKAHYAASFGYLNEEGIQAINSNFKRYSFRINTEFKLGKIFTIGENLSVSQIETEGNQSGKVYSFNDALTAPPIYPVYNADSLLDPNEYNRFEGGFFNPVAWMYMNNKQNTNLTVFGNAFVQADFLKYFSFRTSLGINLANSFSEFYWPEYLTPDLHRMTSLVQNNMNRTNSWLWENTLTYQRISGKHAFTALAGYTADYNKFNYMIGAKQDTPNNNPEMRTLDAATIQPQVYGGYAENSMLSMLGRINYVYDNRYLLTASIRRDGSSKFGSGNKWGNFPSAAVSWNISNEGFFSSLKSRLVPLLKIRAGWGRTGNTSMTINTYNAYVSQVHSTEKFRALFDNHPETGYFFKQIGTPDLTWETVEQLNFGLDLGLFQNALTFTAEYFIKTTRDMLVPVNTPMYSGYPIADRPWINNGTVENRGFEIMLNYRGRSGDFTYDISCNLSSYKNMVINLDADSTYYLYDAEYLNVRTTEGMPIGSFFGFVTDGIFQNDEEVVSYMDSIGNPIQPNASPGDFRFVDVNGDGTIDESDRTFIGNPHPTFVFGFSINLGFRGFDLYSFWQGVSGNKLWNQQLNWSAFYNGIWGGNVFRERCEEAWNGPGTSNTQPRMTTDQSNLNGRESDFFVEDGSYLRMKNVQLGYTLPEQLSRKLGMARCRIWIGAYNLLTFTRYTGIDPEVALINPLNTGYDQGSAYPKNRKILVGVNITF